MPHAALPSDNETRGVGRPPAPSTEQRTFAGRFDGPGANGQPPVRLIAHLETEDGVKKVTIRRATGAQVPHNRLEDRYLICCLTGYCYDLIMMGHKPIDPLDEHPECPERIRRVAEVLGGKPVFLNLTLRFITTLSD